MYKIIVVGPKNIMYYKDSECKSILEMIRDFNNSNIEMNGYDYANMSEKEKVFLKQTMKSPYNRLVILGDLMSDFLNYGISPSNIISIYNKNPKQSNLMFQQYIKSPKFNNVPDLKENNITLHRKGTEDLIIVKPEFTEEEPEFNEVPQPSFSSTLQRINKYSYFFGIDELSLYKNEINNDCCFISTFINIGKIKENDYIQIDADYFINEKSSIEFYIIDGEKEVPILPYKEKIINNEKIFYNSWSRFTIDNSKPIYIKKNSMNSPIKLEDAITKTDGIYTISYTPLNCYDYKPKNETIQIKVITRMYEYDDQPPFINYINIRKFGDEMLWKDNI